MENFKDKTIGSFVVDNYRTAALFEKYTIDFCCKGNRTLSEVCILQEIDEETITAELQQLMSATSGPVENYNNWPPDLLVDYIEKKHHRYVGQTIPKLLAYLEKVESAHGPNHPEVHEIASLFRQSAGELTQHTKKEELMLFPYIRLMVEAEINQQKPMAAHFGTVANPIRMMMHEHDNEGERFRKIAALSNNYTPPADACNTFRLTYALLQEFEHDLHLHIHLENNILYPTSVLLEASFSA